MNQLDHWRIQALVRGNAGRWPFVLLAIYAGVGICLLGVKPLWLDEIVQLLGTANIGFSAMLRGARNPGASVLPNLLEWVVLQLGHSREMVRTPAFLFGIAASICFWRLARQIGVRHPLAATVAFALLPINFRYATEARPYSQASFFCCWALLLTFQIDLAPSWKLSLGLMIVVTGGLYSQPFVFLPVLAVTLATVLSSPDRRRAWRFQLTPLIGAAILYLPWWMVAIKTWDGEAAQAGLYTGSTVFDSRVVLRIIHEWIGGGYLAGGFLIICISVALRAGGRRRIQTILLWGTLGGIALILLAEDRLHYFFAARHLMFTLPAAVLLAATAFGSESHPAQSNRIRAVACVCWVALVVVSLGSIVADEVRPHEDWDVVAKRLMQVGKTDVCIEGVTPDRMTLFGYFQPSLRERACRFGNDGLVVVVDPYSSAEMKARKLDELARDRWVQRRIEKIGKFEILNFDRQ